MSSALHDLHMAVAVCGGRFRWCKSHGEGYKALTLKLTLATSTLRIPTCYFAGGSAVALDALLSKQPLQRGQQTAELTNSLNTIIKTVQ